MLTKLTQKLIAEAVGTFFLCFVVSCSSHAGDVAPIAVGGVLAVLVYALGPASGAHLNPAVTVAILARGGELIAAKEALLYVTAQALGALSAALFAAGCWSLDSNAFPAPAEGVSLAVAATCEVLMTFALAYVVLHVATRDVVKGNSYFGLAIGGVLLSAAVSIGGITGCALNPAVGILAFINGSGGAATAWLYLVAPPVGGLLAGLVYRFTTSEMAYAPLLVEFIGTFYLCFTIATAVASGSALAPLAIGSMLMAMVYAGGPISGACYNPAVAFAASVRNVGTGLAPAMPVGKAAAYTAVECAGALAAGFAAAYVVGADAVGHPAVGEGVGIFSALLAEILGTLLLVLTVLSVATVPSTKNNDYYGLAIGFAVVAAAYSVGPVSGGAFNPAVSMLNVVGGDVAAMPLYWIGPLLGALGGVGKFRAAYYDDVDAEAAAFGEPKPYTPV